MTDPEAWTCGKGLAASAVLPAKLGALIAAMAELLDNHARSLSEDDANSGRELTAYKRLVKDQRAIAASLTGLAAAMESYRGLPAAPHEESVLADQKSRDVFAAFVDAEESVVTVLQEQIAEYRAMLSEWN
jgi:hypothetical protein